VRLVKAEIHGFGRLADDTINLDNKVLAIVGPNEAGKTTLLDALAYVNDGSALPLTSRSRAITVTDTDEVIRVQYLLDKGDQEAVKEFDLEDLPSVLWLSRTAAGGDIRPYASPEPRKAVAPLAAAWSDVLQFAESKKLALLDPVPTGDDDEQDVDEARQTLRPRFTTMIEDIARDLESNDLAEIAVPQRALIEQIANEIAGFAAVLPVGEALGRILEWIDRDDPAPLVNKQLMERSPDIVLFSDADRSLQSSYALSDELISNVPFALRNLANMAKLDLTGLWTSVQNGDEGDRETRLLNANELLKQKFSQAWQQSSLSARFKVEASSLSVMILQDGDRITVFHERSAGLRMFVALIAFLAERGTERPPILLIDEAETHLHVDAQADLVNTFMTQNQAAKIIYTTHSPACLPPDLGSNIRAILPQENNAQRSDIAGSFWHGAAGFTPLMLAMGAAAAAFSAARYVVLAEGASEMLLLPSLIRAATGEADLLYQIAPGLSEVPASFYPELDLEGSRVAFLVDGDRGGLAKREALIAGGIPDHRIVVLDALTLENLLDSPTYLDVVRELVAECNSGKTIPPVPELAAVDSQLWPAQLEAWATAAGLKMPGKRAVASRIVEDEKAIPSDFGKKALVLVHRRLLRVLKS
jgi:predicted ATP-dependent endonuclease of OLD family